MAKFIKSVPNPKILVCKEFYKYIEIYGVLLASNLFYALRVSFLCSHVSKRWNREPLPPFIFCIAVIAPHTENKNVCAIGEKERPTRPDDLSSFLS